MVLGKAEMRSRCAVLADDLTGACDSAVQFRMRGASSMVHLRVGQAGTGEYEVNAFSTDSRDLAPGETARRIRRSARQILEWEPQIIFKKIDSTLRGNPGAEIRTALEAFGCDAAIITPAYPDMGRVVHGGSLNLQGDAAWIPITVAGRLRDQGLDSCCHVHGGELCAALGRGSRFVSAEAKCNEDLDAIAKEGLRSGRRILWAGSAGLAAALARILFGAEETPVVCERKNLPVLFCIGSDHAVTRAQVAELLKERAACETGLEEPRPGVHSIIPIERGMTQPEAIRKLLGDIREVAGALFLCGGDTASLVLRSIEAEGIELQGEIVAGLPWGVLKGGLLDGVPVATKSGGFGGPDALVKVADFFTCH